MPASETTPAERPRDREPWVSVVVAMKDEEHALGTLARELGGLRELLAGHRLAHLRRADEPVLEVVLVDDGSVDGTAAAAERVVAARPGWCLLRHGGNRGFGAAMRTGVAATRGRVVVSYDADCAYPAADVVALLDALHAGADVASATPFAAGGDTAVGSAPSAPLRRLWLSRCCSWLYRAALRGRAADVRTFTCAFRAYRGELVRSLDWEADGFLAAAEIVSRLLLRGARVVEVGSTLRERTSGRSKMRVVRTTLAHLGLLARLAVVPPRSSRPGPAVAT